MRALALLALSTLALAAEPPVPVNPLEATFTADYFSFNHRTGLLEKL